MTKRMLVDATHPEETRVAIVDSHRDTYRLDDLDFGLASKPILRGNIYLAKVMRIEPSLQAAFVEYGGNRHGFLPFSEIHPDYFRIPVADRPADEEEPEIEEAEPLNGETVEEVESAEPAAGEAEGEEPSPPPPAEATAEPQGPLTSFADSDPHDSLITDFGNAVVGAPDPSLIEPMPVESVGGDMSERIVRRSRERYKIQEVLKRGQVMLIQVVKEERGNKGAALTSFLSLAGRYCVLMPNTDHGGGVSRKITNHQDRRRMKEILDQLEIPEGMAVILRTAGMEQEPPEIQRDLEYLLRLWDSIREQTLQSTAPSLIYEEANLIKRSIRDLFSRDLTEILVAGEDGYNRAREFMSALMPDQMDKIRLYNDPIPLFFRYHVESQIDSLHNPIVQLRSGGYIVINPTEALVAIDVNSGRATRERHIEETALKTNLEAADEIARQLRLRDLAGLVVIDFIDMEDGRNNAAVERRLKDAMRNDRARLQIGRISLFGLLELSRQRLRPSLLEINFEKCPHCAGMGYVRMVDSASLSVLRAIEEEGIRKGSADLTISVPARIALYVLNQKRDALSAIEKRYGLHVLLQSDDTLVPPNYKIERAKSRSGSRKEGPAVNADQVLAEAERELPPLPPAPENDSPAEETDGNTAEVQTENAPEERGRFRRRGGRDNRRGGRYGRDRGPRQDQPYQNETPSDSIGNEALPAAPAGDSEAEMNIGNTTEGDFNQDDPNRQRRHRRGRRGGRRRNGDDRYGNNERGSGQGHYRQGNNNRWTPRGGYGQQSSSAPAGDFAPAERPASIHEIIDTTPRENSPVTSRAPALASAGPLPPPAPHEAFDTTPRSENFVSPPRQVSSVPDVVNPPTESPKGGWWRRLTGV